VRLGNGAEEVVDGVVLRGMVMGMEVTKVEPCELVVVMFPKGVDDVELLVVELLLLPERGEVLVVRAPESEDCAAEGVAVKTRAERRKSERNRFILVRFRTEDDAQQSQQCAKIPLDQLLPFSHE